jgi:transposase-like protein
MNQSGRHWAQWAGEHGDGEGAKYWMRVLSEIKNRGVRDVLMVVCDGLKGLPDAVSATWDKTIVQTCIVHYADLPIMPTWQRECLVAA